MKKYKKCLILGKFMPPHKGHEYMIRFAQQYAEKVVVVVDCLKEQTISPEKRKSWLKEQISDITVVALNHYMPQSPDETPQFWQIWKDELMSAVDQDAPDLVIAAMDYGWKLAEVMECDFIPIDISRETFPISGTILREEIFENWDFLMDSAKPDYIKKICLLGPESTGKSFSGKILAKKLNTIYVPEYAKAIIDKQNGQFFESNIELVASAQINTEKSLARFTNKIMVCDSSALTTLIYSEYLFHKRSEFLENLIKNHRYDLYCLYYPDNPFFDDTHRKVLSNPQELRIEFFNLFKKELENFGLSYHIIRGSYQERDSQLFSLAKSLEPVKQLKK